MKKTVKIASRFCGPPKSGNGGYVCGLVGEALQNSATVRLFLPPPLDKDLILSVHEAEAQLMDGTQPIAKGWVDTFSLECPVAPTFKEAEAASQQFIGHERHPFPTCFVCGPHRSEGDGLRIFPGPLSDTDVVAAPWIPDASLSCSQGNGSENIDRIFIWAALDCTSAFPLLPTDEGKALVLGQMSVQIERDVMVGEQCVMIGWPSYVEGKKHFSSSAIITEDGSVAAMAKAIWIEVVAKDFQ